MAVMNDNFIYEFDNHYKSLVKDSDYFVTGSINWLSNRKGKILSELGKHGYRNLRSENLTIASQ